jgi:hypothetical protein
VLAINRDVEAMVMIIVRSGRLIDLNLQQLRKDRKESFKTNCCFASFAPLR